MKLLNVVLFLEENTPSTNILSLILHYDTRDNQMTWMGQPLHVDPLRPWIHVQRTDQNHQKQISTLYTCFYPLALRLAISGMHCNHLLGSLNPTNLYFAVRSKRKQARVWLPKKHQATNGSSCWYISTSQPALLLIGVDLASFVFDSVFSRLPFSPSKAQQFPGTSNTNSARQKERFSNSHWWIIRSLKNFSKDSVQNVQGPSWLTRDQNIPLMRVQSTGQGDWMNKYTLLLCFKHMI